MIEIYDGHTISRLRTLPSTRHLERILMLNSEYYRKVSLTVNMKRGEPGPIHFLCNSTTFGRYEEMLVNTVFNFYEIQPHTVDMKKC